MDTAAFVCIPADMSVQPTWSIHGDSSMGANNFYMNIMNVAANTTVMCTVNDNVTTATLVVQGT